MVQGHYGFLFADLCKDALFFHQVGGQAGAVKGIEDADEEKQVGHIRGEIVYEKRLLPQVFRTDNSKGIMTFVWRMMSRWIALNYTGPILI